MECAQENSSAIMSSTSTNKKDMQRASITFSTKSSITEDTASTALSSEFSSGGFEVVGAAPALPSAQKARDSERIEKQLTTINRLNFDAIGLYGREQELGILERCLAPKELEASKKQVIFIDGLAGTGKTSLAFSMRRSVQQKNGIFCSGKFDLQLREVPYSGIAQACNEICSQLLSLSTETDDINLEKTSSLEQVRADLAAGLRSNQRELLIRLVPSLRYILIEDDTDMGGDSEFSSIRDSSSILEDGNEQSLNELNYAFQSFLRLISSRFNMLLMVLDDLQWADAASIALVETLLTDREESKLIVLGLYRTNEVPSTHYLSKSINELKDMSPKHRFSVTELSIGNLEVSNVQSILVELLSIADEKKSKELAELCYRRTEGNPFFLLYYIRILKERDILTFNIGTMQWAWDVARAQEVGATDNIVELLKEKMRLLSPDFQKFLLIAACLGSSVEVSILLLSWKELCKDEESSEKAEMGMSYLDLGIEEGYFEHQKSSSRYYWVHDRLLEASLSLVDQASLRSMKLKIGAILKACFSKARLKENIFLVMNLLNEAIPIELNTDAERLELAELNLRAARKASSLSAFASATKYSASGIKFLPQSSWATEKALTLSLYTCAAEAESCLRKIESMHLYTSQITSRKELSLLEKMSAYNLESHQMHESGSIGEAQIKSIDLLRKNGLKFPRNSLSIGVSTIRTVIGIKKTIAKIDERSVLEIPLMTDKKQLEIMKFLERLCLSTYLLKDDLLPFVVWKSIETTMKYGMSKNSVNGFLFGGVIVGAAFSDFDGIANLGDALLKYFEQPQIVDRRPRVLFAAHTFWLPWTRPLQSMAKDLMISYQKGLEAGDTESAIWCIYHYLLYAFISGKSLSILRDDCFTYIPQAYDLKFETIASFQRVVFDSILKCIGKGEEASSHVDFGRTSISEISPSSASFGSDSPLDVLLHGVLTLQRHVIFNEFDVAGGLSIAQGETFSKESVGNPVLMMTTFYSSFALFAKISSKSCSNLKKRKFFKIAKMKHRIIKGWVKRNNPNVVHSDICLDAETALYHRKFQEAEALYQQAITRAARGGFIQDAGLISERYSRYLSEVCDPPQRKDALFHLDRAIDFYTSWGSTKKVSMLIEARKDLHSCT